MAWRNPLFPKKRGGRSTGMRSVGYWSEMFLSVSLLLVGGTTLGLHVFQVLLPDWRESRAPRGFLPGTCQVTQLEVHRRDNPLGVGEFGIEIQAARLTDEGALPPVWIERQLGHFSPSHEDTMEMAQAYNPGTEHPCWYDPANPNRLVLRRSVRWWVWPVTLIPVSLLGVGIWGIVASLMQVATSAERRSLVSTRAVRLDPLRESPPESAMMPSVEMEDESPGTHYAHRLPVIGTAAWRMAGLMIVCAIWNTLLAYFVYVASKQVINGNPPWLALGLVVLLGMIGVWLAFNLIREFWDRRGIGPTQLEVSAYPLVLGGQYGAYLMQSGRMQLNWLVVELVCEESASYRQGTDSRTSTEVVVRQELRSWQHLKIEPHLPFEADLGFTISDTAMHSFHSPHNEIRWMLIVRGETSRRQEVYRQFAMRVRPVSQMDTDPALSTLETPSPDEALA